MSQKRSLFFRIKWWKIFLVVAVPLYVVGAFVNASRVAGELEPVAAEFHAANVRCEEAVEDAGDSIVETLDCGGAYDRVVAKRDRFAHGHGCWNSTWWRVSKRGTEIITSAPVSVTCVLPWPF